MCALLSLKVLEPSTSLSRFSEDYSHFSGDTHKARFWLATEQVLLAQSVVISTNRWITELQIMYVL
jgi:hypothetical protein